MPMMMRGVKALHASTKSSSSMALRSGQIPPSGSASRFNQTKRVRERRFYFGRRSPCTYNFVVEYEKRCGLNVCVCVCVAPGHYAHHPIYGQRMRVKKQIVI